MREGHGVAKGQIQTREPKAPVVLGQTKKSKAEVDAAVRGHRNPAKKDSTAFTEKDSKDLSLTAIRDNIVKQKEEEYLKDNSISKKDFDDVNKHPEKARLVSKWREEGNREAYKQVQDRVDIGLYDPAAIAHEIKKDLGVTDAIPTGITDKKSAMDAIKEELNNFQKGLFKRGVLTNELRKHLEKDIEKTMEAYLEVYPDKTPLEAFVFCRDLGRNAIYQLLHDKHAFTGSDHGVLHIHHNCKNGDTMHEHMEKDDMSPKAKLLARVMHFYHDIGYSVGSGTHFAVMKDHPFIGAKFIDANRQYFEHYLDPEATDIIRDSILHHAVVSFDSNPKSDLAMVRFTTSNSDACAVTADQKTQSFWREHPQTLISLAKLRQFLIIFPEMGSKLSNTKIMNHPEEVFKLKAGVDPKRFTDANNPLTENDFVDPLEYKAWTVFSTVRSELMAVVETVNLPAEEKEAFKKAIEENFNSFSGDIVLGQYGAALNRVSVTLNTKHGKDEPKYLPAIDLSPSILFSFLESCYSKETAGKNISKVCNEEYYANPKDVSEALDTVANPAAVDKVTVPSPVAHITISRPTEMRKPTRAADMSQVRLRPSREVSIHHEMDVHGTIIFTQRVKKVEGQLAALQKTFVPFTTRKALNEVIVVFKKISEAKDSDERKKGLKDFDRVKTELQIFIQDPKYAEISDKINEVNTWLKGLPRDPKSWDAKTKEQFAQFIIEIRMACTTDDEWKFMNITK